MDPFGSSEYHGSFGINQDIMDPLGSIQDYYYDFYVVCLALVEGVYSEVSVGGLTEIFLSHPAPFCFQIARYTEIEDCQGF